MERLVIEDEIVKVVLTEEGCVFCGFSKSYCDRKKFRYNLMFCVLVWSDNHRCVGCPLAKWIRV